LIKGKKKIQTDEVQIDPKSWKKKIKLYFSHTLKVKANRGGTDRGRNSPKRTQVQLAGVTTPKAEPLVIIVFNLNLN